MDGVNWRPPMPREVSRESRFEIRGNNHVQTIRSKGIAIGVALVGSEQGQVP